MKPEEPTVAEFHLYLYGPNRSPLATSFEAAAQRLERLERLHFEPDGSFVWARRQGLEQVFGMLYDAGGQLQYVDLRGRCRRETFAELIAAISGSLGEMSVVQLPEGSLQDLQSFESNLWP